MDKVLLQLGTFGFLLIAGLYIIKEIGIFAWISKYIHSKLPREKSMAVWALVRKKKWVVGYAQITYCHGDEYRTVSGQVEILDNYTVIRTTNKTLAVSNFQVCQITFNQEVENEKL